MYNSKTIQNLKPQWYLDLSKKEKLKEQNRLKDERTEMWNDKPAEIKTGSKLIAKLSTKSITENRTYIVRGYFATLVTTIYQSCWNEFITIKNDYGHTVKMNLNKFQVK